MTVFWDSIELLANDRSHWPSAEGGVCHAFSDD